MKIYKNGIAAMNNNLTERKGNVFKIKSLTVKEWDNIAIEQQENYINKNNIKVRYNKKNKLNGGMKNEKIL